MEISSVHSFTHYMLQNSNCYLINPFLEYYNIDDGYVINTFIVIINITNNCIIQVIMLSRSYRKLNLQIEISEIY